MSDDTRIGDEVSDEQGSTADLSRRAFMAGAGTVGATVVLSGHAAGVEEFLPVQADDVQEWNREADVVVLGYGGAGGAAAIEAANNGVSVLALEKAESGGGTTTHANGIIYMGGGTALQEALGVEDSPEAMTTYLQARNPNKDPERIRRFAEGSTDFYDWMTEIGVPFTERLVEVKVVGAVGGGLAYSGSEAAYPYSEIAEPAPRGHRIEGEGNSAHKLWTALDQTARDAGVEVATQVEAQRLVVEDERVVGIQATSPNGSMNVRANQAVIIATGGFGYNDQMINDNAPESLVGVGPIGVVPVHDGLGIKMAQAVGAQTVNMDDFYGYQFIHPSGVVNDGAMNEAMLKGVLVNGRGQRFINEDRYGGDVGTAILADQGGTAFFIIDDQIVQDAGGMPEHLTLIQSAETIDEVANAIDVSASVLSNTMDLYNASAENGADILFNKAETYVEPLTTPPYHVFDCRAQEANIAYQTLGGLKTNVDGQVMDAFDESIDGLYAASRAVSGIPGESQESGLSLASVVFFGRLAGQSAAGESDQ